MRCYLASNTQTTKLILIISVGYSGDGWIFSEGKKAHSTNVKDTKFSFIIQNAPMIIVIIVKDLNYFLFK